MPWRDFAAVIFGLTRMLDRLKRILRRPALNVAAENSDEAPSSPRPIGDYVIDPVQVFRVLKDLQKCHALLSVRVPGVHRAFLSSLLDVDGEENLIVLDELNPNRGHELLARRDHFVVDALLRKVTVSFRVTNFLIGEQDGIPFLKARIPEEIYYPQRRKSRRITVHSALRIPFQANLAAEPYRLDGNLANLSEGGLAAVVSLPLEAKLPRELKNCYVSFPEGDVIGFSLSIRYEKRISKEKQMIIGGSFSDIDLVDCAKIKQFLGALERDQLRHRVYPV